MRQRRTAKSTYMIVISLVVIVGILVSACGGGRSQTSDPNDGKIKVVASTSFIADVVQIVAGDAVELTLLLEPGQNPHAYQPTPKDMVAVTEADLFLVNGYGLEEFLDDLLAGSDTSAEIIVVSEGIDLLEGEIHDHDDDHDGEDHDDDHDGEDHDDNHDGEDHDDDHDGEDHDDDHDGEDHDDDHDGEDHDDDQDGEDDDDDHDGEDHDDDHDGEDHDDDHDEEAMGFDPHVWFDPTNILIWVENIAAALEEIDPENAGVYQQNAEDYSAELIALDLWIEEQIDSIPEENRELVTDHTSLGYFASRYGFEQIGAVIPALTTEAETSGMELAELTETIRKHKAKAVFVGADFDQSLAERVAEEAGVPLVQLYFGSLSAGEPAGTYLEFMRYNVNVITEALR